MDCDLELRRDLVKLLNQNSQKVFQFLSTSARPFSCAQSISFLLAALGPGRLSLD